MPIPFEPKIFGLTINVHLILEYAAFFTGYRYYISLRKNSTDSISSLNRMTIILGAASGALAGSRVIGFLENPSTVAGLLDIYNAKTIMGGLFGGLLGVEITKSLIGETQSSGDLFTLPIIVGIIVGRMGCFLAGTREFTYGRTTSLPLGMDLGDGMRRHPIVLYEIIFLLLLFIVLKRIRDRGNLSNGLLFKLFMIAYFGFRFLIEFIKPNEFFVLELSTIQWLCIICFVYYWKTLITLPRAYKEIHLL